MDTYNKKTTLNEINISANLITETVKENKDKNSLLTFVGIASNSYFLMMKNHFKSSSFWISCLLIPIIAVFTLSLYFPISYSFIWMLYLGLGYASLTTFGSLFFTIKKSTMIKNVDLTINETSSLYFSSLLAMFTSAIIALAVIMITLFTLDSVGIASHQFSFNTAVEGILFIDYLNIWWGMIIYYLFAQTLLCFAIAFLFEQVMENQKTYYIAVYIYMLGGMFFGGIISSTLNVLYDENDNFIGITIWTQDSIEQSFTENGYVSVQGIMPTQQKGGVMWFISQFWPHYGLNQVAYNSLAAGAYHGTAANPNAEIYTQWANINMWDAMSSEWLLYYTILPWIWFVFLLTTASFLARWKDR